MKRARDLAIWMHFIKICVCVWPPKKRTKCVVNGSQQQYAYFFLCCSYWWLQTQMFSETKKPTMWTMRASIELLVSWVYTDVTLVVLVCGDGFHRIFLREPISWTFHDNFVKNQYQQTPSQHSPWYYYSLLLARWMWTIAAAAAAPNQTTTNELQIDTKQLW